jgi:cytidylate kinase
VKLTLRMAAMCVITISRGSLSGGKWLAETLASALGYRCIDRDTILNRASLCGVAYEELQEALVKAPSFLEHFSRKRYLYLTLIRSALLEELREGSAIYHGNAGHLLLRGAPHVLRVRVIAPLEFRLAMAQERLHLNRAEAIAHIRQVDEERRRWTQYLYGVNWADPALYDMVLNLEHMDIDQACNAVITALRRPCFQFTRRCRAIMNELTVASRVQASLVLDPSTCHLDVEVVASGGAVRVIGKLTDVEEVRDVERVVLAVPGVSVLNVDELVPPLYV